MSFADEPQDEQLTEEQYDESGNLAPDPFAEVPAGAAEEDLPPGVEPGSLGGVNPSEEAERLKAEAEAAGQVEDPGPGPGDELPEDDEPLPPEDAGLGDEVAPLAEEDPLVVDGVRYDEGEEAAMAAADLGQETETDQEDLTAHDTGGQDNRTPVGGSEIGPQSQVREADIELQPGQRRYTILSLYAEVEHGGTEPHGNIWEEVLEEPIIARSGELALRKAYRMLAGATAASYKLVPVPTKYWRPEDVEGEVPAASMAIRVGKKK